MTHALPSASTDATYSVGDGDFGDDWYEDVTDDGFEASEMRRENNNRCNLFQTIGYRDGVIAGKEAAAQKGFNSGFLQSVTIGCKWGYVRGITGAFAVLPESLKDKLARNPEAKYRLEFLHESAQNISTNDAIKIFQESSLYGNTVQPQENSVNKFCSGRSVALEMESNKDQLSQLFKELQSVLQETSAIKVHNEFCRMMPEKD